MRSLKPLFQTCAMVFLASLSVIGFEVALVRLCSVRYSYHYATIIISISMVGFVLGGVFSFLRRKPFLRRPLPDPFSPRTLLPFLAVLAIAMPLIGAAPGIVPFDQYRLLWQKDQILYLMMLACVLSFPFFVYGTMMSLLFRAGPGLTGRIYAADLSGAAAGVLATLLLTDRYSPEQVIAILTAFPAIAAVMGSRRKRAAALGLSLYLLCAYGVTSFGQAPLPVSPYAGLSQALKEEGSRLVETIHSADSRIDLFENPRMRFAPGLSLDYGKPVPRGLGLAVDGTVSGVIMDERKISSYDFFGYMPAASPYLLLDRPRVVVSGNKGGIEVLMARHFGARDILWADRDLSLERLVRERYGQTGPYGEAFRRESIRELLHRSGSVDLIVISRIAFAPSGAFGLHEDYETTVEALRTYLSSLTQHGLLYIQLFILPPPRYELRMANNLARALRDMGVSNAGDCILAFRSWDTMNFLARKGGFTTRDRSVIDRFLEDRGFDRVWPGSAGPGSILGVDYSEALRRIIDQKGAVDKGPFDVRVTTDDRPFFHYFLKATSIGEVYRLSGKKWVYFLYEGMALPFLAGFLFLLSLAIFAGVLLFSRVGRTRIKRSHDPVPSPGDSLLRRSARYLFFTLIGTGFMFAEVFFLHALMLPLGSPTRAFAFALVTLLLGCGTGSLASGRLGRRGLAIGVSLAPILLSLGVLCLPFVRESLLLVLLALLCGLPLGLFFPSGMRLLFAKASGAIPLAYAVNGAASIVAPPLASVVASAVGLRMLLFCSVGIYLAAALVFVSLLPARGCAFTASPRGLS